jgi:hypothetical protein
MSCQFSNATTTLRANRYGEISPRRWRKGEQPAAWHQHRHAPHRRHALRNDVQAKLRVHRIGGESPLRLVALRLRRDHDIAGAVREEHVRLAAGRIVRDLLPLPGADAVDHLHHILRLHQSLVGAIAEPDARQVHGVQHTLPPAGVPVPHRLDKAPHRVAR